MYGAVCGCTCIRVRVCPEGQKCIRRPDVCEGLMRIGCVHVCTCACVLNVRVCV